MNSEKKKTFWDHFVEWLFRRKSLTYILYVLILYCLGQLTALASEEEIRQLISDVQSSYPVRSWQYYLASIAGILYLSASPLALTINISLILLISVLIVATSKKPPLIVSDNISGNVSIRIFKLLDFKSTLLIILSICVGLFISYKWEDFKKNVGLDKIYDKSDGSTGINILLLPFNPDRSCSIEDTDYEKFVIDHYRKISEELNLNLSIKLLEEKICPSTDKEAIDIGKYHNSDLVVWGYYDEKCEGPMKVRLRYSLVKEIGWSIPHKTGDTQMQPVEDIQDLRNGYLQNEIDYIVYLTLGIVEYKANDFNSALRYFDMLNDQEDSTLLLLVAQSSMKLRDHDRILITYSKLLELDPQNPSYLNNRALSYESTNQQQKAILDLTKAIQIEPYSSIYYYNRGRIFLRIKEYQKSISDFEKTIKLKPENGTTYSYLGRIYYRMNDTIKTKYFLNKGIEIAPKNPFCYVVRAEYFLDQNKYEKALNDLISARKYDPNYANIYRKEAEILAKLGRNQEAIEVINQGLKYNPRNLNLLEEKVHFLRSTGAWDRIPSVENKILEIDSLNPNRFIERAQDLRWQDPEKALIYFSKAIKLSPDEAHFYIKRGEFYQQGKKYRKAEDDFNRAIKLDPDNDLAYYSRSNFFKEIGDINKAIDDFEEVIALSLTSSHIKQIYYTTDQLYVEIIRLYHMNNKMESAQLYLNKLSKSKDINMTKKAQELKKELF